MNERATVSDTLVMLTGWQRTMGTKAGFKFRDRPSKMDSDRFYLTWRNVDKKREFERYLSP